MQNRKHVDSTNKNKYGQRVGTLVKLPHKPLQFHTNGRNLLVLYYLQMEFSHTAKGSITVNITYTIPGYSKRAVKVKYKELE